MWMKDVARIVQNYHMRATILLLLIIFYNYEKCSTTKIHHIDTLLVMYGNT